VLKGKSSAAPVGIATPGAAAPQPAE
jgi:hypothetical protein